MLPVYWTQAEKEPEVPLSRAEHRAGLSLLSAGLSALYNVQIEPERLSELLDTGHQGKPFLRDLPGVHFNISHCGGLVLCAFGDEPLGLDVERVTSFLPSLLKKALTAEEQAFLDRRAPEEERARQELFFRLWTLKEALLKQTGEGLSRPLTDISFRLEEDMPTGNILCGLPGLCFYQTLWREDFVVSACSPSPIEGFSFIPLTPGA